MSICENKLVDQVKAKILAPLWRGCCSFISKINFWFTIFEVFSHFFLEIGHNVRNIALKLDAFWFASNSRNYIPAKCSSRVPFVDTIIVWLFHRENALFFQNYYFRNLNNIRENYYPRNLIFLTHEIIHPAKISTVILFLLV